MAIAESQLNSTLPKEMQEHHYPILFEVEESHWWYLGRRDLLASCVSDIKQEMRVSDMRILDVGCGTGANLKMLAQFGRAEGIDLSQQALDFCKERGLNGVQYGEAENLPFENGSYDLVTALDVLEHLDDDGTGLNEIYRVLRPNGRALIFVPAFMFLWGVQDDVSNHRRRYTRSELTTAVQKAGLEVELASYANFTFFFPVLAVRTVMRLFKITADSEYGINLPFLNKVFAKLFSAESFFVKKNLFPFGVSLLCIARKVA